MLRFPVAQSNGSYFMPCMPETYTADVEEQNIPCLRGLDGYVNEARRLVLVRRLRNLRASHAT